MTARTDGIRITLSSCNEGLGDTKHEQNFYFKSLSTEHESPQDYWDNWLGQECIHSRNTCAIHKHLVDLQQSTPVIVTKNLPTGMINQPVFPDIEQALDFAIEACNPNPRIAVFDKGGMMLASLK